MKLVLMLSLLSSPVPADTLAEAFQAARAAAPKPPVCSHPMTSASTGGDYGLSVFSGVCMFDPPPASFIKAMEEGYAVYGAKPPAGQKSYVYETRITNTGTVALEVVYSDDDFLRSPFPETAGSYSVKLAPGKSLVVVYATPLAPKAIVSPSHFARLDAAGKFNGEGGGATSFWVPDGWATIFQPLKSAVVDKP